MSWYHIAFQGAFIAVFAHYFLHRSSSEHYAIEGPVPPLVGKKKEEWRVVFPEAKPFTILFQINMVAMLMSAFFIMHLIKNSGIFTVFSLSVILIPIHLLIARLLEIKISGLRGPSRMQADLLNSLARRNPTVMARLVDIQKHEKLTFAEAREIMEEHEYEIVFEDQHKESAQQLTLPNRASGSPLSYALFSGDITFYPYVDGWYRAFIIDSRVHEMLCNGAAGPDAGLYHRIANDHCLGIWSIPSSFTGKIADRIARLSGIHGSDNTPDPKMPPPDDPPSGGSPIFA